jgi:alpha-beta hydrolase superfamily lysophospholipase
MPDCAIHVSDVTAVAADDVVMVVPDTELEPGRRPGRLDAAHEARVGQGMKDVIDRLRGHRAQRASRGGCHVVGIGVGLVRQRIEDGQSGLGDPQADAAQQLPGIPGWRGVGGGHDPTQSSFLEWFKTGHAGDVHHLWGVRRHDGAMTHDVLGEPYRVESFELPPDDEGKVVATLVSLHPDQPTGRAVLHVHGFADYFFHTEYAEWWVARGYTFYALDLRKYGRSLRPHQTPNYVADLRDYFPELDLAWWRITQRDGHDHVIASAHSTGGLTLPLWLNHRRQPELVGLVLNSPWFDMQGSMWLRTPAGRVALEQLGSRKPMQAIPRNVSGVYARSLHRDYEGEWDFDLAWKPMESHTVYAGWLRAIRRGHAELHEGLDVPCPSLVLSSATTFWATDMDEEVHRNDIVLDVEQIRRWASSLGRHVTSIAIDGALHDVVLSAPPVRREVYRVLEQWLGAFVEHP